MLIGPPGDAPASGRAGEEAHLHQIGLVYVLQGDSFLVDGGRQGLQTHWAAAVVLNNGAEHPPVDGVQPQVIHLQGGQGHVGHLPGDDAPGLHLGKVTHPAQHPVGDPGGTPAALGDLHSAVRLDGHIQDARRPGDNEGQLLRGVQLQPQGHTKPVPQRGGQLARPGGGSDEGEFGQVQPDRVGRRSLADDDIDGKVLHGRIQDLLHRPVEPVDLIHEQDVVFCQIGKQGRQIAGLFDGRAGGDADVDPHLVGNDVGEGGLTQAGRAVEQHMVQRLVPHFGSLDKDLQVALGLGLTDVFV